MHDLCVCYCICLFVNEGNFDISNHFYHSFDVLDRFVCVGKLDGKYCLDWPSGLALAGWVGEQKLGFE